MVKNTFILLLVLLSGCMKSHIKVVDLTLGKEMSLADKQEFLESYPWAVKAQVVTIGPYQIIAAADSPGEDLVIKLNGKLFLIASQDIEDGIVEYVTYFQDGKLSIARSLGTVSIFEIANQRNKGSRIHLNDWNHDDIYDELIYTDRTLTTSEQQIDYIDAGLDGQLDKKIVFTDKTLDIYIWVRNDWYLKEKRGDDSGVVINGEWLKVIFNKNDRKWYFDKKD